MNWLDKFFSNKNNKSMETTNNLDVMKDLFIDETQPVEEPSIETAETNLVVEFLNQDFYSKGYSDGYKNHSSEIMENVIKGIKAEFRILIDRLVDLKRKAKQNVLNIQAETGKITEGLNIQCANIIKDIDESIETLLEEKKNSAQDEGWVMNVIHKYREGYAKGAMRYQEEKLLAITTGMFN